MKSGGGDFVVLRVTGTDAYKPYIYNMRGVDSVETLIVKTREAANDPYVIGRLQKAETVLSAGGDRNDYIRLSKGTSLASSLKTLMDNKVPVRGTSAGLAVLGWDRPSSQAASARKG